MTKELQENLESIQNQVVPFVQALQQAIEKMRPTMIAISEAAARFQREYGPIIQQFGESLHFIAHEFAEKAQKWQQKQKINVSLLAENGWFPNWYTFFYYPSDDFKSIDDFMIAHIDECWDELKHKIIELSPSREHILKVAFELHEQANYIASIPILLSQSDGICSEEFTHFFSKDSTTGRRASDEIVLQAQNNELAVNFLTDILLEPFKMKLQISQGSNKASPAAKAKGPNRHGIIHGSHKHLDYGSKINGYKAISFLAFIVFTTKDKLKKHNK